jgi:hypothetical protein
VRGTYKVRLGGLGELLLGRRSHVGIWEESAQAEAGKRLKGMPWKYTPGDRVPSKTWLISMFAEGAWRGTECRGGGKDRDKLRSGWAVRCWGEIVGKEMRWQKLKLAVDGRVRRDFEKRLSTRTRELPHYELT